MVQDDPGKRNKLAVIEKPTQTTTAGKVSTTWASFARAWVKLEPLSGNEYWEANRQASSITHKITGTYHDFENVTADFRIKINGRTFNLKESPRNIEEANVLFEVMVEEGKR